MKGGSFEFETRASFCANERCSGASAEVVSSFVATWLTQWETAFRLYFFTKTAAFVSDHILSTVGCFLTW